MSRKPLDLFIARQRQANGRFNASALLDLSDDLFVEVERQGREIQALRELYRDENNARAACEACGYSDGVWTLKMDGGPAFMTNVAHALASHPKLGAPPDGPTSQALVRLLAAAADAADSHSERTA